MDLRTGALYAIECSAIVNKLTDAPLHDPVVWGTAVRRLETTSDSNTKISVENPEAR